ncbi:hypothetical protein FHG87_021093 [Trinorchestia longiramus]|nr:hypothetical protein FHG87_021093 [Trinorchestia longiramus]
MIFKFKKLFPKNNQFFCGSLRLQKPSSACGSLTPCCLSWSPFCGPRRHFVALDAILWPSTPLCGPRRHFVALSTPLCGPRRRYDCCRRHLVIGGRNFVRDLRELPRSLVKTSNGFSLSTIGTTTEQ